jgi:predicted PurR-regulated permease PerM
MASRYTATVGLIAFAAILASFADPTAYASFSSAGTIAYFFVLIGLILLVFYLPLSGAHRRLVSEKDRLLQNVASNIATILARIHSAAFEQQDYQEVGGMRNVLSALREEQQAIQELSTWPWRRGTFTGLLSALFLPVVLLLIREIITRLLAS